MIVIVPSNGDGGVGVGGFEFVGGNARSFSGDSTPSLDLTALTGGLASHPSAGDLVLALAVINDPTNRDFAMLTAGYTEGTDSVSGSGIGVCQAASYRKVLTGADTSLQISTVVSTGVIMASVWRGCDAANPYVGGGAIATGSSGTPNPPSIGTTGGSPRLIVAFGAQAGGFSALTAPSGMSFLVQASISGTCAGGIAAMIQDTAAIYDPAAFGGGLGNWIAITYPFKAG